MRVMVCAVLDCEERVIELADRAAVFPFAGEPMARILSSRINAKAPTLHTRCVMIRVDSESTDQDGNAIWDDDAWDAFRKALSIGELPLIRDCEPLLDQRLAPLPEREWFSR